MEKNLSFSVSIHEEKVPDGTKVFVVEALELGVSDFGETLEEAINNLKNAVHLLLEEAPEKRELLEKEEPQMITRIFL
jgi:predicted RNase H-like HicB family nuclease